MAVARAAGRATAVSAVLGCQRLQADHHADAFHAASLQHRPAAIARVWPNRLDLPQQAIAATFDRRDFLFATSLCPYLSFRACESF